MKPLNMCMTDDVHYMLVTMSLCSVSLLMEPTPSAHNTVNVW